MRPEDEEAYHAAPAPQGPRGDSDPAWSDAVSTALLECRGGRVVRANARLAEWVGRTEGGSLVGCCPDAWLADAGAGLPDWLAGEAPIVRDGDVECTLRGPSGARRVRARPLGAGRWELLDCTRRHALEEELHRVGSALLSVRREAEALRERLGREAKERDELLSVVSHELQTPLTVISGFTRLLLSEQVGALNEEQRHFLAESAKSCRRLSGFIASLMEAETRGGGSGALELRASPLGPAVQAVSDMLRPLLQERGQRLRLALDPRASFARFDPVRMEQVLINLLANALKYGPPGGEIVVATRPLAAAGHRFVEVSVSDDGPGVPEADRERIFEPYVRAGRSAEGEGLGLGLAICKRLVTAHGGTVSVSASASGGSRFAFTLEAADAADAADAAEAAEGAPAGAEG